MKHIKLLSSEFLEIEYNLIDDILVGNWSGEPTNEVIRSGYENLSYFLKKQFCHKLLDNHLEIRGMWSEVSSWVALDWHPKAEEMGLHYHACAYSKDAFSRLSTDQMIRMVQRGITKGFDTVEAAEGWLKAW